MNEPAPLLRYRLTGHAKFEMRRRGSQKRISPERFPIQHRWMK